MSEFDKPEDDIDDIRPIETMDVSSSAGQNQAEVISVPDDGKPISRVSKEDLLDKEIDKAEKEDNFAVKGDFIDLTKKKPQLKQVRISMGWDMKNYEGDPLDLDVSLFLLNIDEQTRNDDDFVFYNNVNILDGAVRHQFDSRTGAGDGDDETVVVDLNGVPFDVVKIMVVLSIYDQGFKDADFSMVKNVYVSITDNEDKNEIIRYDITEEELASGSAMRVAAIVREGPVWFFEALGENSNGSLGQIATDYGIIVQEILSTGS